MIVKILVLEKNKYKLLAVGDYEGTITSKEYEDKYEVYLKPNNPYKVGGVISLNKVKLREFKIKEAE